jgi:transcription initiation factor TFIIIB Brf1 subunit/transcription initiation factor TFIIB
LRIGHHSYLKHESRTLENPQIEHGPEWGSQEEQQVKVRSAEVESVLGQGEELGDDAGGRRSSERHELSMSRQQIRRLRSA